MELTRRRFLGLAGRGLAMTAAGVLVPEAPKRIYSFLQGNPIGIDAELDLRRLLPIVDFPLFRNDGERGWSVSFLAIDGNGVSVMQNAARVLVVDEVP